MNLGPALTFEKLSFEKCNSLEVWAVPKKNRKQSACTLSSKDLKESQAFRNYFHQLEPLERNQNLHMILYPIWPGISYERLEVDNGKNRVVF